MRFTSFSKSHLALLATLLAVAGSPALAQPHGAHTPHHAPASRAQQAWGVAGDAKTVSRSITITMDDSMRFSPDQLQVRQGETIRFVISNKGKLPHEMVIGDKKYIDRHAAEMAQAPGMAHAEPSMAQVAPGQSGQLIWTFNRSGNFDFACLIPGHYQAGMRGNITVAAR